MVRKLICNNKKCLTTIWLQVNIMLWLISSKLDATAPKFAYYEDDDNEDKLTKTTVSLQGFYQHTYHMSIRKGYKGDSISKHNVMLLPHVSSAALINNLTVLTSASAMRRINLINFTLFVASACSKPGMRENVPQFRKVRKIIVHPDYDEISFQNNIAVVVMESKFRRSRGISVIPIQSLSFTGKLDYNDCKMTSWLVHSDPGLVSFNGRLNARLVSITNDDDCSTSSSHSTIPTGSVCAIPKSNETDDSLVSSYLDSGGPLVCSGILIGVRQYSSVTKSLKSSDTHVFVNVSYYYEWIWDVAISKELYIHHSINILLLTTTYALLNIFP